MLDKKAAKEYLWTVAMEERETRELSPSDELERYLDKIEQDARLF